MLKGSGDNFGPHVTHDGSPEKHVKDFMRRHRLLVAAVAVVIAGACLVWAVLVIGRPLPPRIVVMTTGPDGESYREWGEKYRAALARNGVDLRLIPSAGDVENLARLGDPASGVSAGFVAGGLAGAKRSPDIVSLGTLSYDPLWIFCRGIPGPVQPGNLGGKRISIGPEGSGTRAMMLEAFRVLGLKDFTPLPLTSRIGGEALLAGEIDCACMLTDSDAPIVRRLLADERIALMAVPRADAYVALYPYLKKLTAPHGVGDFAKDLPKEDVTLLAPMTGLLVRRDLHPAIQFLLLEAASEIHSEPGIFSRPGQFPSPEPVDFPLSKQVLTYHRSGGSFLQRSLPFWLAVLAERLLIVLVPLAGVAYPLLKLIPSVRDWFIEQRLRRFYTELREVEAVIAAGGEDGAGRLAALEKRVSAAWVPASHTHVLYNLKGHVAFIRSRLGAA